MKTHKKKSSSYIVWLILLSFILGALYLPTGILLAAGLMPTFLTCFLEDNPRKSASINVFMLNLVGILPFLIDLWQGDDTIAHAVRILARVENLAIMYGAACVGGLSYLTVPRLVVIFLTNRAENRLADLEKKQAALRVEWGEDVAKSSEFY